MRSIGMTAVTGSGGCVRDHGVAGLPACLAGLDAAGVLAVREAELIPKAMLCSFPGADGGSVSNIVAGPCRRVGTRL
jgi:hypothetical protein